MKLKKVVSVALVAALSVGLLAGCGGGKDDKDMTITVAASPSPHAEILAVAAEVLAEEGYTLEIKEFTDYVVPNTVVEEGEIDEEMPYARTSGENAWVNIMQGCNNFCTYCIVPYVRGREKSREKENILKEIRELVACGKYKTITLLGQNVNSYGKDLKEPVTFAELLSEICKIEGDFEVGFMTSHPKDLSDELIDVISNEIKIKKEIHLPAQSGNDRVLALMNRKYTREKYMSIINKIKAKIPNVKLTSDFIVGFPTETEEEFEDTCSLVKEVEYSGIFAFMYSPRIGTIASTMDGQIDDETKHRRVNKLLAIQKEIQQKVK